LLQLAIRINKKFGTWDDGKPKDWTEWRDFAEAISNAGKDRIKMKATLNKASAVHN